jgi:fluoroquinolone resistance protein
MNDLYNDARTYEKQDFTENYLPEGEYDNCFFKSCDFSGSSLANIKFMECEFENCNLSMVKLINTSLLEVRFANCKMLGLHFDDCNEFGLSVSFEGCILNHCTFYRTKLKRTVFTNSKLLETDFTECDLSYSFFDNCDLAGATFQGTNMEKADLRSAFNFSIDPEKNRLKKAKFSLSGIAGLLDKHDIEIH